MAELKPCPFCGGEVKIYTCDKASSFDCWFTVGVTGKNGCDCRYSMNSQLFNAADKDARERARQQLVGAWNRRADNG